MAGFGGGTGAGAEDVSKKEKSALAQGSTIAVAEETGKITGPLDLPLCPIPLRAYILGLADDGVKISSRLGLGR